MAPEAKPSRGGAAQETATASPEEALKPFQDASMKFLKTSFSAQEGFMRQRAQACLDLQGQVRKVENDAHQAITDVTKKHMEAMGAEAALTARAQAQADYEKDVRKIYSDAQNKLMAIYQKAYADGFSGDQVKSYTTQRQGAYQSYLADLQHAWTATKSLDPQTMNAIASSILLTMNAAG